MTWDEICADRSLDDLPYKIEQDRYGRIVMSPRPPFYHGSLQARVAALLSELLPDWSVATECSIRTAEGVKVPDVLALPRAKTDAHWDSLCLPYAADLCVEILSAANSDEEMDERRRQYASTGCREFWICDREGRMRFLEAGGAELARSRLCPGFPVRITPGGRA